MKLIQFLTFLGLSLFSVSTMGQVKTVTPEQMNTDAKKVKASFLDVRTPQEWNKGHIQGALHLDLFNDNFESELKKLDKNKVYYVYCAVGGRSAEACEMMVKMGFKNVYNMQGGFNAWSKAGLPVTNK
ncbi:MAG: rhodanese-like domain-containing protein [Bacteroidia bacterium]|nr:rhodanese-like domain-containing protein [Bacteroidia bacterium]